MKDNNFSLQSTVLYLLADFNKNEITITLITIARNQKNLKIFPEEPTSTILIFGWVSLTEVG
jgi:hypothetical protein